MSSQDDILLHYTMLEYLYSNCVLASSCNNHCWEAFRVKHVQYRNFLAEDLKRTFWSDIMPAINSYHHQLVKPEMLKYFTSGIFFDNASYKDIAKGKYEPKNNVDYRVFSSPGKASEDVNRNELRETENEKIKFPRLNKGNFESDDENEPEFKFPITLCTIRPPPPPIEDDDVDLIQTFNEALRTKDDCEQGITELSHKEILKRLSNPNILSDIESFKKLPGGIQKFMEQFPFFSERLPAANPSPSLPPTPPEDNFPQDTQSSGAFSDKENSIASNT